MLRFFLMTAPLKTTLRAGWVRAEVQGRVESVSDHCYRMGLMAMVMEPPEGVDRGDAVQMALLHDLPESVCGDIMPEEYSGVSREQKHCLEESAALQIFGAIPAGQQKQKERLQRLYSEYEAQKSPTAVWVKELDVLEMLLQAATYEEEPDLDLESFFRSSKAVRSDAGKELLVEILQYRQSRSAAQ